MLEHPTQSLSRTAMLGRITLAVFALAGASTLAVANEPDLNPINHEQLVFFESKVRPLLLEHCISCHGEEKQEGGLRLDSRANVLAGGESGEAIVPGDSNASLLISAVRYEGYEMPPKGKLPDASIAVLEKWIVSGAAWPGGDSESAARSTSGSKSFSDEDLNWWAIQPVQRPDVPGVAGELKGWPRGDVDRFIANRLNENSLLPSPEADRRTLIRRLYFDLVGLPPSPTEIDAFLSDDRDDAYEQLVDRLLDSPEYGERWARHWLDLVRYADSDGYRIDHYRPTAWRYRDYVIASFNDDKPYDQFVREQIAGDELYPGNPEALIATGFLRHGIYEYNNRDALGQWDGILNEITDATGDVFLGLGMQCARCHDHKFDPILQKDYFKLRAYFEAISWRDDLDAATSAERAEHEKANKAWLDATAEIRAEIDAIEEPVRASAREKAIIIFPPDIQAMIAKDREARTPREQQLVELAWRQVDFEYTRLDDKIKGEQKERLLELRRDLAKFDSKRPEPLPAVLAATDVGRESPPTIIPKKRTEVQPGVLTLLDPDGVQGVAPSGSDQPENTTGRRSELASWLTNPENPLTTRVIVNRIWQYHFGRPLTANASDFGYLGGPPSHSRLLDWLTSEFVQGGWRLKPLHRMIVTSATYRQSSHHPNFESQQTIDPENTWYWHHNTRRLDAEQIRDSIFAVTARLDARRGGEGTLPDVPRRSIYSRVMRNNRDPLLDAFDLPLFFNSTSTRDTTTTPIQSLLLINSPEMLSHARSLAKRASEASPGNSVDDETATRIRNLWQLATGREPSEDQLQRARYFLETQTEYLAHERESTALAQAETGQMPYRDGQSVFVNDKNRSAQFLTKSTESLPSGDLTVEAFFQIRSVYDSGSVRTIASSYEADGKKPGWSFGVTGKGSRRKPQTLVMQMFGPSLAKADGSESGPIVEAALFSDQNIELNKPYYAAAAVHMSQDGKPGDVTFYLKDLSNDDQPLDSVTIEHSIVTLGKTDTKDTSKKKLSIAGSLSGSSSVFDGLIDDVRLSNGKLDVGQLLFTSESIQDTTVGYWKFESDPGLLRDSSALGLDLNSDGKTAVYVEPSEQAFVDLCHVLLNSNSFLYVY